MITLYHPYRSIYKIDWIENCACILWYLVFLRGCQFEPSLKDVEFSSTHRMWVGIRPSDFKGEIIVLDSVGHIDGEIFTNSDSEETILDSIQTYFE